MTTTSRTRHKPNPVVEQLADVGQDEHAALVAFETKNAEGVRLIDEPIINTVIVLMVVTSVLGPVLTEWFGKRLVPAKVPPARTPARAA